MKPFIDGDGKNKPTMPDLPTLGHLARKSGVRVSEAVTPAGFVGQGRHLLLGQRRSKGETDALILLGKCIEHTGMRDLFDSNVWLDINNPHVVFICGKRGSGKSYDLGIIVEGLSAGRASKVSSTDAPVSTIVFDTQSQFWTLIMPPRPDVGDDMTQLRMLEEWGLETQGLTNVELIVPRGDEKIFSDVSDFVLATPEMVADDWCGLLRVDRYSPMGQCLRTTFKKVTELGYTHVDSGETVSPTSQYEIADLIECLRNDHDLNDQTQRSTRDAVLWRLDGLEDSRLFDLTGLDVQELLKPGKTSVILMRSLDNATKSLVVGVVAKKIFELMGEYHTKRKISIRRGEDYKPEHELPQSVWIVIDEAHVVCPAGEDTAAKGILTEYVKRGRDAGLSLVMATQQPSAVDPALLSQIDLAIVHRLIYESDITAAMARFPSRISKAVKLGERELNDASSLIRSLEDGVALIGDAETDRGFLIAMRPRLSAHGGGEPILIEKDAEPS